MPRIAWLDKDEADGELAELYTEARGQFNGRVPDILKTMSARPDFLRAFLDMSQLHFSAGALT